MLLQAFFIICYEKKRIETMAMVIDQIMRGKEVREIRTLKPTPC